MRISIALEVLAVTDSPLLSEARPVGPRQSEFELPATESGAIEAQ
jgi:hypothetical protein